MSNIIATFLLTLMFGPSPTVPSVLEKEFKVGSAPELDLENISGDINIYPGTAGKVVVRARVEDDRTEVSLTQAGDKIKVKVLYPKMGFRGGGDVTFDIQFPTSGTLKISSVSGDIRVEGVNGDLTLHSVSGDISVTKLEGELELNSVSGDVKLTKIGVAKVDAISISGEIDYSQGSLLGGLYSFSSTSGKVSVVHDHDAAYEVSGRTISGSITNNVGSSLSVGKNKYSSVQTISGAVNGGGTGLEVNSVSGNISIGYTP
jgi:DUF4097 and DUF4098 domain-containing protein YvlB